MPSSTLLLAISAISVGVSSVAAFVAPSNSGGLASSPLKHQHQQLYALTQDESEANCNAESTASSLTVNASSRRRWIRSIAAPAASALPCLLMNESASAAAASSKTKGSPCDPGDAICRQKVYDRYVDSLQEGRYELPPGQPIPAVTNKITYVVQMIIDIGARRDNDSGYIRFGLYGDACPASVKQMLFLLTRGITSMDQKALEDRLEIESMPVTLGNGNGSVQQICPSRGVEFGVASQSKSYAENKGLRAAGPNFVPQSRPMPTLEGEAFPRKHTGAGLISIPAKGIGYSGSTTADLDEIFSSAFLITADEEPAFDKPNSPEQQRVIGQIIDNESMQFLERLVHLPVQKKLGKGGGSGPPLFKVRVRDVDIQKVGK